MSAPYPLSHPLCARTVVLFPSAPALRKSVRSVRTSAKTERNIWQCCGSGLQIQIFPIPDPDPKNLSIFTQKKIVSKLSEMWSGLFIPDPDPEFLPIPDLWVKKAQDPGARIRIRKTNNCSKSEDENLFFELILLPGQWCNVYPCLYNSLLTNPNYLFRSTLDQRLTIIIIGTSSNFLKIPTLALEFRIASYTKLKFV
jgi:hypothetical protein